MADKVELSPAQLRDLERIHWQSELPSAARKFWWFAKGIMALSDVPAERDLAKAELYELGCALLLQLDYGRNERYELARLLEINLLRGSREVARDRHADWREDLVVRCAVQAAEEARGPTHRTFDIRREREGTSRGETTSRTEFVPADLPFYDTDELGISCFDWLQCRQDQLVIGSLSQFAHEADVLRARYRRGFRSGGRGKETYKRTLTRKHIVGAIEVVARRGWMPTQEKVASELGVKHMTFRRWIVRLGLTWRELVDSVVASSYHDRR